MGLKVFCRISSHSYWMWGRFRRILLVPHNIVMDLNNVMCNVPTIKLFETYRWSTIAMPRGKRLCHSLFLQCGGKWGIFCDGVTSILCTWSLLIRDRLSSTFRNVVLGKLTLFFQLDHRVDISFYLVEATTLIALGNQPLCHHLDLLLAPKAFWLPGPWKSISFYLLHLTFQLS